FTTRAASWSAVSSSARESPGNTNKARATQHDNSHFDRFMLLKYDVRCEAPFNQRACPPDRDSVAFRSCFRTTVAVAGLHISCANRPNAAHGVRNAPQRVTTRVTY